MKKVLTKSDIEKLEPGSSLAVDSDTVLTHVARELAIRRGIRMEAASPAPPGPEGLSSAAPQARAHPSAFVSVVLEGPQAPFLLRRASQALAEACACLEWFQVEEEAHRTRLHLRVFLAEDPAARQRLDIILAKAEQEGAFRIAWVR